MKKNIVFIKNIKSFVDKFLICSFILILVGCSKNNESNKKDTKPPVLSESITDTSLTEEFLVFGYQLSPGRFNPAYEIITSTRTAKVFSATSGVVQSVRFNGGVDESQNDYEIFIKTKGNSIYLILHDHVRNVVVGVGDIVSPGTILGDIGWRGVAQGRTELQINNEDTDRALCPESLGTANFNLSFETARTLNNTTYPSGNPKHFDSVCLSETVVP